MPLAEPHSVKVWAGVILFFGTAVSIGLPVAMAVYSKGHAYGESIFAGAFAGGYGICIVCWLLSAVRKRFRR